MNNKKNGKKLEMKYHCIKCDFHSNDKCDYERHLSTRKHKMDNLDNKTDNKMDNKKTGFLCQNCVKNITEWIVGNRKKNVTK